MAEGYAIVAELAVANCKRTDRDLIIYPVIYDNHHAVELALKYTIAVAYGLFNVRSSVPKIHRVLELWRTLRPLIERHWPNSPKNDLLSVESMIKELNAADENAERFRYPIGRDGRRHFPTGETFEIDLDQFCKSGRKVLTFLDSCSTGMYEDSDAADYS